MDDISIFINNVKFNYRVGLIVEKDNKILVEVNQKTNFVVLPGGRVKTMEHSNIALKREIKEELGIDLSKYEVRKKSIIENFFNMDDYDYHELYFLYKIKFDNSNNTIVDGMKNKDCETCFKWIDKNKLKDIKLFPPILCDMIKENNYEFDNIVDIK